MMGNLSWIQQKDHSFYQCKQVPHFLQSFIKEMHKENHENHESDGVLSSPCPAS